MSTVRLCPASSTDDPHELATNMHRHCPDRETPCKWVICNTCRATVSLTDMKFFRGGTQR